MTYWWVNHKQTGKQEVEGGYLWSPKTERNGFRSEFYNNMRRASPGDVVLSYSHQMIRNVGRVTEFSFTAPKPEEFGHAGKHWQNEGWLLPIYWIPLARAIRPKEMLSSIGPLLPHRYSPINPSTGNGNQKAYLAEIPADLFELLTSGAGSALTTRLNDGLSSVSYDEIVDTIENSIALDSALNLQLSDTTRRSMLLARRGQGLFRENVERLEKACRLTGVTNRMLLIASHIKPWRSCLTAQERLDGNNGLLLTPDADFLFDRGFISFDDSGRPIISSRLSRADLCRMGLGRFADDFQPANDLISGERPVSFRTEQKGYLSYHRSNVFLG